jgi:septal ring factor EnvC (AmiA/AmiB activator)
LSRPPPTASRAAPAARAFFVAAVAIGAAAASIVLPANLAAQVQPVSETAATEARRLADVERDMEHERQRRAALERRSAGLDHDVDKLRADLIAAARAAQQGEADLSRLEARLRELVADEGRLSADLARRHTQIVALAGALERLSRHPPEALFVAPGDPIDVMRGGLLLRTALPRVRAASEKLRGELETLATLRHEIAAQRIRQEAAVVSLGRERRQLDDLMRRKAALRQETVEETRRLVRRLDELAASASGLREFLQRLETDRPARDAPPPGLAPLAPATVVPRGPATGTEDAAPPAPRSIARARGLLTMPAAGRLVERFGEATPGGSLRGLTLRTRPEAPVVAPYDGRIAYAGPFRGYGLILIIDHGEGYHSLLAGLGRLDGVVGQAILAGEPVGMMSPGAASAGEGADPQLYVELRHNGQPINPLPWLAQGKEKVSG